MILAKVIADSIWDENRITTLQLKMPRFILSQFNKHRMFSSNAASSRAIPTAKLLEQVRNDPVIPVQWGKNQAGMVADGVLGVEASDECEAAWLAARDEAVLYAETLLDSGLHKQIANRLLEPFMWAEVVVTATEWDNFFKLRLAHDSQPEMQALAQVMKAAIDSSTPEKSPYHLPYIDKEFLTGAGDAFEFYEQYKMISAARCARVSYLNHDQSQPNLERDLALAYKLKEATHLTPFEHQARAASRGAWFANFKGWVSQRYDMEY